MTDILFEYDHILIRSEYKTPEMHSHLAAHLIAGLNGPVRYDIGGTVSEAEGIMIASDVRHTVFAGTGELLLYLFDTTSRFAEELERLYLRGREYAVIDSGYVEKVRSIWEKSGSDPKKADSEILSVFSLERNSPENKDSRVSEALGYLKGLDTVPEDIMKELCELTCLSQSRLSHIFKEQTGISLHRYLALDKMKKGYIHYLRTGNITDAAMYAGFDSPSHFASTCKRMFGISFSEFAGSMGTKL